MWSKTPKPLVTRDVTKVLFIDHWREQGIECPCGQLLDYNHVNYKCKCCRKCKANIMYCLENNRCRSLSEVQKGMGGLCEIGKPLASQPPELRVVGRNNND